jgi:hypothetical protein
MTTRFSNYRYGALSYAKQIAVRKRRECANTALQNTRLFL